MRPEDGGGTGRFCLLLKMHVDEIFMKCQQEISKHTSMHLHVRTLLAQNPERALKMTGMHPRTRGWGVRSTDGQQYSSCVLATVAVAVGVPTP